MNAGAQQEGPEQVDSGSRARRPVRVARTLGDLLGLGVRRGRPVEAEAAAARAEAEAAAARAEVRRLARLLGAVANVSALDVHELAEGIVDAMAELGYPMAVFGVVDESRSWVVPLASRGFDNVTKGVRLPLGRGLSGKALRTGRIEVVEDYRTFDDRIPERDMVRGAIAAPVFIDELPEAVIQGARAEVGPPPPELRQVVEILAGHAANALRNARRFREEQELVVRLTELDELKDEFLDNLTHELRGPLTVVSGLGSTLRDHGERLPPSTRVDLSERIVANAKRLDEAIEALLALARLQAGDVVLERRPVELDPLVRAAADRFRDVHPSRKLATDVEPATVLADPRLLTHVVDNLLDNAAKHTTAGTAIAIRSRAVDGGVCVEVADEGPGIDADELAQLTRRRYRGPGAQTAGHGIGLALVQQILDCHESGLEIDSAPGSGTVFRFRLSTI